MSQVVGGAVSEALTAPLGVGLIGCGNIATTYLSLSPLFRSVDIRACADVVPAAAKACSKKYGVRAQSVAEMLASDDIDIALNLTIPAAHAEVSLQALNAGKHVFSEKPFVLSLEEGRELGAIARAQKLRIGSAPDTFLGGAHQRARALLDGGAIGRVTSGTAHVLGRGMEHWHPNPDFFFQKGAGPILDIGPYYLTNLVQLLGPVTRVTAMSATPAAKRQITSVPRAGQFVNVETPTTLHAVLAFESGAIVTLGASWDVRAHSHRHMELYGESGTLYLPDPNFFGGQVSLSDGDSPETPASDWPGDGTTTATGSTIFDEHPFSLPNEEHDDGAKANYRTAGLADMATAIQESRSHRCSFELALHVVEVMTAILASAEHNDFVDIETRCDRPAPLLPVDARAMLR